jgi:hypothetical protein
MPTFGGQFLYLQLHSVVHNHNKFNNMTRFIIASVLTGLIFGVLDGLINGNPLATKLMECYQPIAKQSINIPAGIIIDLVYGF